MTSPALDLRIGPRQLPTAQSQPTHPRAVFDRVDRYGAAAPESIEDGLSFGVEIKRPRELENRARPDEADASGLQNDIERLIDHSTLGIRGTYRF